MRNEKTEWKSRIFGGQLKQCGKSIILMQRQVSFRRKLGLLSTALVRHLQLNPITKGFQNFVFPTLKSMFESSSHAPIHIVSIL